MPEPRDWDQRYRVGQTPWDSGIRSRELARLLDSGGLAPCRAIELGCGTGTNAVFLAEQGFTVTAIDDSEPALEQARRRAAEAGAAVRFLKADLCDFQLDVGVFDFVFDRGCYHCVRTVDLPGYLATLERITQPGSWYLCLTGNANAGSENGPPPVRDDEIRSELSSLFEIEFLREFHFEDPGGVDGPLGWACLMIRRNRELPTGRADQETRSDQGTSKSSPSESAATADTEDAGGGSALGRFLCYTLSLPERTVRSTVGLAAGAAQEAASVLVPQAFQDSKTYEIVIRKSLRFLTDDIAGVAAEKTDDASAETDGYMARKAVGSFVDLAGMATLHFSPIWIMAIVSDIAYGSKSYVTELATELKSRGLIDQNSSIDHIDDLLEAVQNTSGQTASMLDTPPLSFDQLKQSLDETRAAVASADYTQVLPESELKAYWQEVRSIAQKEDVGLLGVSGALTMHALGRMADVSRGTLTGVQVAGSLFNRNVVSHYAESLKAVREKGFYETVRDSSAPYVEAVWNNFSKDRETWTEQVVTGNVFKTAFKTVSNWFVGSQRQDDDRHV